MATRFHHALLAKARLDLGLTQEEAAQASGVDVRTYRRYESGEVNDPVKGFEVRHPSRRRILRKLEEELGLADGELLVADSVSKPASKRTWEIRYAHALPRARHFVGREGVLAKLRAWRHASPGGVALLAAVGGAGKTSVVARFLAELHESSLDGGVFVWSFYEDPRVESFFEQAVAYFVDGGERCSPGEREPALERALRERGHLVVLDGLEVMQETGAPGLTHGGGGTLSTYGRVEDGMLRRLLTRMARGLGASRCLVTSRIELTDLAHEDQGYLCHRLGALSGAEGATLLRSWGIRGEERDLAPLLAEVQGHALSVAMIGSYAATFLAGDATRAHAIHGVAPYRAALDGEHRGDRDGPKVPPARGEGRARTERRRRRDGLRHRGIRARRERRVPAFRGALLEPRIPSRPESPAGQGGTHGRTRVSGVRVGAGGCAAPRGRRRGRGRRSGERDRVARRSGGASGKGAAPRAARRVGGRQWRLSVPAGRVDRFDPFQGRTPPARARPRAPVRGPSRPLPQCELELGRLLVVARVPCPSHGRGAGRHPEVGEIRCTDSRSVARSETHAAPLAQRASGEGRAGQENGELWRDVRAHRHGTPPAVSESMLLASTSVRSLGLLLLASAAACGGTVESPLTETGDAGGSDDGGGRPDTGPHTGYEGGTCNLVEIENPILTIVDAVTGAPICGATVVGDAGTISLSLSGNAGACTPYTVTGYDGSAATFSITVTAPGYETATVDNLSVTYCGCDQPCVSVPEESVSLSPLVDGGGPFPDSGFDGGFPDSGVDGGFPDSGVDSGFDAGASPCPSTHPITGAPCSFMDLDCEYGNDPSPYCNDLAECNDGTWVKEPARGSCPSSPNTCAPYATLAAGGSCSPNGQICASAEGTCVCSNDPGGLPVGGGPEWSCNPASSGCPSPRPQLGTACDGSTTPDECDYGACSGGVAQACVDGYWALTEVLCAG